MPFKQSQQPVTVNRVLFEKLNYATVILQTACTQRNCNQMLGLHDPRRRPLNCRLDCVVHTLALQIVAWGKKLNGPATNDDMFILLSTTLCPEVLVDRSKAHQTLVQGQGKDRENVNVKRRRWLQVKRRAHRAADGVFADDAVGLHLVDRFKRSLHGFIVATVPVQTKREAVILTASRWPQGLEPVFLFASDAALKRRSSTFTFTYAALLGPLASRVFSLPTFTLICFGLASAFFGRAIFNTPLS